MTRRMAPLARLRRSRGARSAGALLGILALLFQMGVPLAHDPLVLGAAAPWLGIPVCHVGMPQDTPSAPTQPDRLAPCAVCLGLAASACLVLPPAAGGIVLAASPAPSTLAPPAFERPARDVGGFAQPRAPPVLA
ncbi:MAG TPA: DUF2946 family protein [Stellaceae bacterium]|nr:DUF2946 family protein [Stellaceae bacterium]